VAPQQQTDWTLYDRRRKIFEDIQEFIAYVLRNNGDFELAGPGEYRDFRRNMDVAEDLYGTPDVRAVLKAFDENVREFWASAQTRKRAIETGDIKAINRNHELLSGIISFGERIPEVFKSHLAAGGNTGKSAESPRMALRPTGKYPTVVQGWSYFSISVCNEDKRYGESLYGVRGYLSFTSPRGKRHQEQEALFCIRRPAEEFPFDFREVVPELALGDYSVELVLAFCVPDACGSKYYTGKSYPPNLPLEAEITNGLWRCSAIVTWAGGGELRAEYTLGVQPGQPIEIAEQSQHFEERKAAHGDGGDVIVLEQFVKRLQDQDAKIASAAGAIPPRVLGELIRLFEEINRSCPSLLEPFEGHGNAVVLRSQISTAVGKVSARIDDLKLGRPI
jgi:hypothetical protein